MTLFVAPSPPAANLCTPHIASGSLTYSTQLMAAMSSPRIKLSCFTPLRDGEKHKEEKEKVKKPHVSVGSERSFL